MRKYRLLFSTLGASTLVLSILFGASLGNRASNSVQLDNRIYSMSMDVMAAQVVARKEATADIGAIEDIDDSYEPSDEIELTSMNVAAGSPTVYISENSQSSVINGKENLTQKYAPYLNYGGKTAFNDPELLYILETECEKYDLDPYFIVGVIMTESGGNPNAKSKLSTATGLGQLIKGTAKSVYEDTLGHGKGTYNHNMAYDPKLNVQMTVTYMGTLKQRYGLMGAIRAYRGIPNVGSYVSSIKKFMSWSGHTI